jgi:hypothetical protein
MCGRDARGPSNALTLAGNENGGEGLAVRRNRKLTVCVKNLVELAFSKAVGFPGLRHYYILLCLVCLEGSYRCW